MSHFVSLTHTKTHIHMHSYLDLGQSVHSLPVPDGEDVIIGVVYNTQCVSSILAYRK